MKSFILTSKLFVLICAFSYSSFAQAPEKLSYQAVIRNNVGTLVSNSPIGVKVSILQGSIGGPVVFSETHTINSNENGLISFQIGDGNPSVGLISDIEWSQGPYFIKNEHDINGGTNYTLVGTSELLSVPYALYAKNGLPTAQEGATMHFENGEWIADKTIFNNGSYVGVNQEYPIGSSVFDITSETADSQWGGMYVNTSHPNGKPFYGFATDGQGRTWFEVRGTSNDLVYYNGSSDIFTIAGDDKVGIANTNPQYTLDINGTMRLNTGTDATNKVLAGNNPSGELTWTSIDDAHISDMERSVFISFESFGESTGNSIITRIYNSYQFTNDFGEGAAGNVALPSDWDGTPFSVDLYFHKSTSATGTAGFFIRAAGIALGENYIVDPGATTAPLVTVSSSSGILYKQTFTISNVSLTDEFLRFFAIQRNDSGTFTDAIFFTGMKLRYNAKR